MSLFEELSDEQLEEMLDAGAEVMECYRVLRKADANVVGEILKGAGTFYEWDHYPDGDVFDDETHSQYYYHAHRSETGEHGHFHTFLRAGAVPDNMQPVPHEGEEEWPEGDDTITHLIAVAMDKRGYPTHLFTTNRWVTGETFFAAEDMIPLIPRFEMDHVYPSWPTNRWLTALIRLFRPQIAILIRQRDEAIAKKMVENPDNDVYEDRDFEITSVSSISVNQQIKHLQKEKKRRRKG